MPRRFRLRALVARLKKTLVAERKEQFIIFSACCEHVDHPTAIDFAELEAALGKIRVVRSVGKFLWFEAESGVRAVAVVFRRINARVVHHPAGNLLHRFAPAVTLVGETFERVGLAGLLAGADAVASRPPGLRGRLNTPKSLREIFSCCASLRPDG
jgi:hypothetical protein